MLVDPAQTTAAQIRADAYQAMGRTALSVFSSRDYLERTFGPDKGIRALSYNDTLYHMQHLRSKATPYRDYPRHVAFETYAKCNATCSFCVYPNMARKDTMMPMELIDKIIDDLTEIPRNVGFQLSPFAVNEPFLDYRLFDVLDKIVHKLPNAVLTITSNASPLTLKKLEKLSTYKLDYLWLSVVDYRQDVYEAKMKLSFDRLLARLDMIHKAKEEGWFPYRTVLSRLMDHTEHDQKYRDFFNARYPLFETVLWPYADWLGKSGNPITSEIANVPCSHWFEFRVDAKGLVQHCCMDGHTEYPWGDVNKNTVLEIYNSPAYKKLRTETFSRLEIQPCDKCNLR